MLAPDQTIPAGLVHPDSLGDTLDAINAALFYQLPLTQAQRWEASRWVAERQGLPRSYAGMFAPTAYDQAMGALTFTGEPIVSGEGSAHLLSEESCRALLCLGAADLPEVSQALQSARRAIMRRLRASLPEEDWIGVYCCGPCTVALWRHLSVSGYREDELRLENGLFQIKRRRDGKGQWKQYPFYYTLLALLDIDLPAARSEVEYALPAIERALRQIEKADPESETEYQRRRRIIMGRLLERF